MTTSEAGPDVKPKEGTCGHPALFTWHFLGYERVQPCLYCERDRLRLQVDAQCKVIGDSSND